MLVNNIIRIFLHRFVTAPVIAASRLLLISIALISTQAAGDNSTVYITGDSSIVIDKKLQSIQPPAMIFNQSSEYQHNNSDRWYRLDLERSPYSTSSWLMVFRQIPYQQLDIFIPVNSHEPNEGYQLKKMGLDNRSSPLNTETLPISIKPGEQQIWYFRYQAISPNQLMPQIWPEDLYLQQKNSQDTLIVAVQILLLASLLFIAFLTYRQCTRTVLLLIAHIITANLLLETIPWLGDPGHWLIMMTSLVLITSLFYYRHLTSMTTHAPLIDKAIQVICALSLALIVYYLSSPVALPPEVLKTAAYSLFAGYMLVIMGAMHCWYYGIRPARLALSGLFILTTTLTISWQLEYWPRSIPSYPEIMVISLHAALLPIVYWLSFHQQHGQSIAINVVNETQQRRRIYETALREHLQNPQKLLDESEIPNRVLSIVGEVLPDIPSMILVYENHQWDIVGEYSRAAENLRSQLPAIERDLLQVVASGLENQINFKDKLGRNYWIFPLGADDERTLLMVLAPSKSQRNSTDWQTAGDISSHARTVLQTSRQSQFWQQQACLDSLTGLLNRRAFTREAGPIIQKALADDEISPCSVLFIDIDHFKTINDQFGHARGDQILKDTANLCREVLRHQDLLCRYGGEEFIALLPGAEPWHALHVAERIRTKIETSFILPNEETMTLSIGLSALSNETNNLEKLIDEADKAMYLAKRAGRNQTCISTQLKDSRLPTA